MDHTVYWAAFGDPDEADYIAAILNSDTTNKTIKPFQSRGLLGQRHVHKKLLELPIPTFNAANNTHKVLADLGAKARATTVAALKSGEFPGSSSLARQRGFVRENVSGLLRDIDKLVRELW